MADRVTRRKLITSTTCGVAGYSVLGAVPGRGESVASSQSAANEIADWQDLHQIRDNLGGPYTLVADLDENTAGYSTFAGSSGLGWEPIGDFTDRFAGTIDGNGHEIRDLHIERSEVTRVGLVSHLTGTIKNLTLTNVNITGDSRVGALAGEVDDGEILDCSVEGVVRGTDSVGALAGFCGGPIENSSANADVEATSAVGGLVGSGADDIHECSASGDVIGEEWVGGVAGTVQRADVSTTEATGNVTGEEQVGGLIGNARSSGEVSDASASGDVTGSEQVGGLIGRNDHEVVDSSATGAVDGDEEVGGLIGANGDAVTTSEATGDVRGDTYVGGLIGSGGEEVIDCSASGDVSGEDVVGGGIGRNRGTFEASTATGDVSGTTAVGGLVGDNETRGSIVGSTSTGAVTGDMQVGGLVGKNEDNTVTNSFYNIDEVTINGENKVTIGGIYGDQYENWQSNGALSVEEYDSLSVDGDTIEISDVQGMRDALGFTNDPSFDLRLGDDIDLTQDSNELHIPLLRGDFDGNEHAVAIDVDLPSSDAVGFIGFNDGGEVSKLTVIGEAAGNDFVGGIVGWGDRGTVEQSSANVDVSGRNEVGGLVGKCEGDLSNTYATGAVDGDSQVGGLAGRKRFVDISDSFATGSVTGSEDVGGFIGLHGSGASASGRIDGCYWDREATGQQDGLNGDDGDLTGLDTEEMQGEAAEESMQSLNFREIWQVVTEPAGYPIFQWQVPHEEPVDPEQSEDESGDGTGDEDADDTGAGFGVGGALAGVGGVAYLLKQRLGTTESDSK